MGAMGRNVARRTKEYAQTGANDHEEHGFWGVAPLEAGCSQMFSSPYEYVASNLIDGFIFLETCFNHNWA